MKITYLTIFPELFHSFFSTSLIEKAQAKEIINLNTVNIRDFAEAPHFKVDDSPYGGGPGMVMKPEPLVKAIEATEKLLSTPKKILLSASGKLFSQEDAKRLSKEKSIIFVCGRYEGIDERVTELSIDEEFSVGEYVVMGGEIPAMLMTEAIVRLIPGVIGNSDSIVTESYAESSEILEGPQYTRPEEFRGKIVPEVLLSGNHKDIKEWRKKEGSRRGAKYQKN